MRRYSGPLSDVERILRDAADENVRRTAEMIHAMDFSDAARAIPSSVQRSIAAAHEILQCVARIEHLADYSADEAINYAADLLGQEADGSLLPYKHERRSLTMAVASYLRAVSSHNGE